MALGAHWFSHSRPAPPNWNAIGQLMRANFLPVTFSHTGDLTVVKPILQPQPRQSQHLDVTVSSPTVKFYGQLNREIRTAA
jgi:hypothetical protein